MVAHSNQNIKLFLGMGVQFFKRMGINAVRYDALKLQLSYTYILLYVNGRENSPFTSCEGTIFPST